MGDFCETEMSKTCSRITAIASYVDGDNRDRGDRSPALSCLQKSTSGTSILTERMSGIVISKINALK